VFDIKILHKNGSVCFLKIWSFCPFFRLNSPKKQGTKYEGQGTGDRDKGEGARRKEQGTWENKPKYFLHAS